MAQTERTVKYATRVDSLPEAWSFIMGHLEELGDAPTISIKPFWIVTDEMPIGDDMSLHFDVSVSSFTSID